MGAEQNAYIRLFQYLQESTIALSVTVGLVGELLNSGQNTFDKAEFVQPFALVERFLRDGKTGVTNRFSPTGVSAEERLAAQVAMAANGILLSDLDELEADGASYVMAQLNGVSIGFYYFRQQTILEAKLGPLNSSLGDLYLEATMEMLGLRQMLARIIYPHHLST
jgi:hypothetical protein